MTDPIGDPKPLPTPPPDVPLPVPSLFEAGPHSLDWSITGDMLPQTAQVERSDDGIAWTVFETTEWGADSDIFTGGYYRVIGLTSGQPVTQYSNVLQL